MNKELEKLALNISPQLRNTLRLAGGSAVLPGLAGAAVGGIGGALSEDGSALGGALKGGLAGAGLGAASGAAFGYGMQSPAPWASNMRNSMRGMMGAAEYNDFRNAAGLGKQAALCAYGLEKTAVAPLIAGIAAGAAKLAPMALAGGKALAARMGTQALIGGGIGAAQGLMSGEGAKGALLRGGIGAASGAIKNPILGTAAHLGGSMAADKIMAPKAPGLA